MQSWLLSLLPVANLGFAALSFSYPSLALPDPGPSSPLRCSQLLVRAGWAVISAVTLLFLFFCLNLKIITALLQSSFPPVISPFP